MAYDIERYLNVRSAHGGAFLADGGLAFLMDTTGTPQVWTIDDALGWPTQRTFRDERITVVDPSPTRPELIFGTDEGGNERVQLFRLALDDAEDLLLPLTAMPDAKHRWGGWDSTGDRFAFTSNRRDESVFDVYVQDRTERGDDATLLYEGDGWLTVAGFGPEDERLLVSRAYSNFDQDLYALDLASGDRRHLTPHEGDVRYYSPEWGPEGGIYCTTDLDSDTLYLARVDPETAAMEPVVDGGEWNVDGVRIDEATGRIVYSRNVDGATELTVGDLVGPTEIDGRPTPDLPDGTAGGVDFDDGAERFALTVSADTRNTSVYVVDVGSGAVERWTAPPTAGIPVESFRPADPIRYESFDGLSIPAFFTLPADPTPGETPVVVDIHGGPESQRRPSFRPVRQYLLNRGYAVFEPNVRGSTGYGQTYSRRDDVRNRMDSVRDVRAGVEWLHDRRVVDPDRIAAMGGSYGGFMVLACLTEYPDLWAAGVDIVGIADFVTFLENTGSWRRALREAEYGSLADDREFLESISPINNAEAIRAPLFVLHGANDPRVPVGEAERIAAKASEHVPVETMIFEDEGHGISKRENRIEAYGATADFLDEHVGAE